MVLLIWKSHLYFLMYLLASVRTLELSDKDEDTIEKLLLADEIEEKIFRQLEIDAIWRSYLKPIEIKGVENVPVEESENSVDQLVKFRNRGSEEETFKKFERQKTTHEEIYFLVNIVSQEGIIERTALRDPRRLWEGKIVPYTLSDSYEQSQLDVILKAIEGFHNETCLTFKQREDETTFISIEPGTGCSAVLGKQEGLNRVKISENCYEVGIIQHEIMHVFGFLHEQSRPDRDEYVTVMWDNIAERYKKNFDKKTWDQVQVFGQPYDYDSILHYGRFEFAINHSKPSIIPLQEGVEIGKRGSFSKIDIIKINTLFDCTNENS